jgi:hypothetical protein
VRLFFSSLVAAIVAMPALADDVPRFQVDSTWPKPLPNDWIMGQAAGVAVDAQDHIWVIQRPRTLTDDEKALTLNPPPSKCCRPAPAVMEFDGEGNLIQAWGGAGEGYDWPQNEHGISIDAAGFVWIGGNGDNDGQYLKFTRAGKFVLQIGKSGPQTNSNDLTRLGRPADAEVNRKRTKSTSPTDISITASSYSTPTPAPTNGTGAPTAKSPPMRNCLTARQRRRHRSLAIRSTA